MECESRFTYLFAERHCSPELFAAPLTRCRSARAAPSGKDHPRVGRSANNGHRYTLTSRTPTNRNQAKLSPKAGRGFHSACADLKPAKRLVVYPGTERFPLDDATDAIGIVALAQALRSIG